MTTKRKRPAARRPRGGRKPAARRTGRRRRIQVRNPVQFRNPIVRNKLPRRRTTLTVGSVIVAVLGIVAYVVGSVLMIAVTILSALATGLLAAAGQPGGSPVPAVGKIGGRGTPRSAGGKTPPPGSVMCGAPTRDHGRCMRFTMPGQNCGVPSHPAPAAPGAWRHAPAGSYEHRYPAPPPRPARDRAFLKAQEQARQRTETPEEGE